MSPSAKIVGLRYEADNMAILLQNIPEGRGESMYISLKTGVSFGLCARDDRFMSLMGRNLEGENVRFELRFGA